MEITLPRDANIHAREYQLYLPDKELLRRKLAEWGEEVGDAAAIKESLTTSEARQADIKEIAELERIEKQLERNKETR